MKSSLKCVSVIDLYAKYLEYGEDGISLLALYVTAGEKSMGFMHMYIEVLKANFARMIKKDLRICKIYQFSTEITQF